MIDNFALNALGTVALFVNVFILGNPSFPVNKNSETPKKAEIQKEKPFWVVKQGETLSSIAEKVYGDNELWISIWNDNPWIENPDQIISEWKLTLRKEKPKEVEKMNPQLAQKYEKVKYVYQPAFSSVSYFKDVTSNIVQNTSTQTISNSSTPLSSFDEVYKEAGAKYGVSWEILYGLHKTESGFYDGPISNHEGSGAQGPMQFMPGTWQAYGADGNGDGVADINNAKDAIHGAANFLAKHGSLENGLRYYGGNTLGVIAAAQSRGFSQ